jgi:tyrosyl-tRNA synthetase
VWLDPQRTSPYKFYQFWLNVSDDDAEKYIKIFTLLSREEVSGLVKQHLEAPHLRGLQKILAKELCIMVHGEEEYKSAVEASEILFGKATTDSLAKIREDVFLSVFDGVPQFEISDANINTDVLTFLVETTGIFSSKGELRRLIKGGGISINKEKVESEELIISLNQFINKKYVLVQKGKKNYFLVKVKP